MDPELEKLLRICDKLIGFLSHKEEREIVCILEFVRQEALRRYGNMDDLAASMAFSKLSSID
jgi:hypothetical protein